MRLRILTHPTGTIDGVSLDHFIVGGVYELGTQVACVFIAEGWAELVTANNDDVVRPPPSPVAAIEPLVLVVEDDPGLRHLTARRQLLLPVALTHPFCYRRGAVASRSLLPMGQIQGGHDGTEGQR